MPRTRYTRLVRDEQQAQIARQEKELEAIARKLRRHDAEPATGPLVNEAKERRSARVERKRRNKPGRHGGAAGTSQK